MRRYRGQSHEAPAGETPGPRPGSAGSPSGPPCSASRPWTPATSETVLRRQDYDDRQSLTKHNAPEAKTLHRTRAGLPFLPLAARTTASIRSVRAQRPRAEPCTCCGTRPALRNLPASPGECPARPGPGFQPTRPACEFLGFLRELGSGLGPSRRRWPPTRLPLSPRKLRHVRPSSRWTPGAAPPAPTDAVLRAPPGGL